MKILLRKMGSGLILSRTGDWESYANAAWEFNSAADAIKHCVTTKTWEVEIVLRFRQFGETMDIPLQEASFSVESQMSSVESHFQPRRAVTFTD